MTKNSHQIEQKVKLAHTTEKSRGRFSWLSSKPDPEAPTICLQLLALLPSILYATRRQCASQQLHAHILPGFGLAKQSVLPGGSHLSLGLWNNLGHGPSPETTLLGMATM